MYRSDPQHKFQTRVTTLTDHGIEMPPEYTALQRRVDDFANTTGTTPIRDKLVGIVVDGVPDKNHGLAVG
jgi:hypothetical protein